LRNDGKFGSIKRYGAEIGRAIRGMKNPTNEIFEIDEAKEITIKLIRIKYGQWVIDRKVNDKENLKKL
jgi:hypothetical protein